MPRRQVQIPRGQNPCKRLHREFDAQIDRYKTARRALPKRGRTATEVTVINGIRRRAKAARTVARRSGCGWAKMAELPPALPRKAPSKQQSLFGARRRRRKKKGTPAQQAARAAFSACSQQVGPGVPPKRRRKLMSSCLLNK